MAKKQKPSKVKISKIEIEMGDTVVSLTIEEAKNLKSALEELFGKEVKVIEKERLVPRPFPVFPPAVEERPFPPWRKNYEVWCQADDTVRIGLSESKNL